MKEKIKLGRFNYTNVVPVYYGIENYLPKNCCTFSEGPPAVLNSALAEGFLDISPVSAFSYAVNHKKWLIVPNLSISCTGNVISVFLATDHEFEDLDSKKILLTNESASGASLLKILFYEKGIYPEFYTGDINNTDKKDYDGALVIGDNALFGNWDKKFKNIYDLGTLWQNYTSLPFVFGLWAVCRRSYLKDKNTVTAIIKALIGNKDKNILSPLGVINYSSLEKNVDKIFMENYFTAIEYDLSDKKIKALTLFYELLFKHKLIDEPVVPEFINLD